MTIMKRILYLLLAIALCSVTVSSCSGESEDVSDINKQTILVFMPWSGSQSSQGLYSFFRQNLDSIEGAIAKAGKMSGRVLVFLSTSPNSSMLYEITYQGKKIQRDTLLTYSGNLYTTAEGITTILNDVKSHAYALNYAMIIGCHGCGWTYKDDWIDYPYNAKPATPGRQQTAQDTQFKIQLNGGRQLSSDVSPYPVTRFYGSVDDSNYATDIPSLSEGIAGAGIKMQYILFDDCYMANVETAYELRNATNFLIGSTSEIFGIGMPYQTMWASLASATPAYATAVSAFHTFYSAYDYPYGTISAIDCRKLDRLAEEMRMINREYSFADSLVDSLQVLDGFNEPIFYDMGDYVAHLCKNTDFLNDFNSLLTQVVKSSAHTDSIYSYLYWGQPRFIKVNHFSGLTISDPSRSSVALKGREKTAWWRDTH